MIPLNAPTSYGTSNGVEGHGPDLASGAGAFRRDHLEDVQERSDGDQRLAEDDIFFVDRGVVWDGHEGDAGATFTDGNDAEMKACADALTVAARQTGSVVGTLAAVGSSK